MEYLNGYGNDLLMNLYLLFHFSKLYSIPKWIQWHWLKHFHQKKNKSKLLVVILIKCKYHIEFSQQQQQQKSKYFIDFVIECKVWFFFLSLKFIGCDKEIECIIDAKSHSIFTATIHSYRKIYIHKIILMVTYEKWRRIVGNCPRITTSRLTFSQFEI